MNVMKKESFGPIMTIQIVSSDSEASELIVYIEFGLTIAVVSNNEPNVVSLLNNSSINSSFLTFY